MYRLKLFGLAFIAMLLVSAVVVAAATAEEEEVGRLLAEWLVNGAGIAASTAFNDSGEFVLGELTGTTIGMKMKCSMILEGVIKVNGGVEITVILNLEKIEVTLAKPLTCTPMGKCEKPMTPDAEVAPEKLPWKGFIYLDAGGKFRENVGQEVWDISCLFGGAKVAQECTNSSEASFELLNVSNGVEQMGVTSSLGKCPLGTGNSFEIERVAENRDQTMLGTLAVSSE